jgi:hypothetical protein
MQFPQQVVVDDPSSICSLGWRPILVTGMLVQEIRDQFSAPDRLEHINLREYLWRSRIDQTSLVVESMTRWNSSLVSSRPAILIRRNAWQTQRLGIGDRMQMATALDGWERFSLLMCGSHTIFCLAREAGECETLAAEVYLQLMQFGQKLRERLDLIRFMVTEIGQMLPVLEAREHFGVPITVAYVHNQSWTVRKHTPILENFALEKYVP